MTRFSSPMDLSHRIVSSRLRPLLAGLLVALAAVAMTACSGSDGGGDAQVEITSISPEETYPGVETNIEFAISPGSGVSAGDLEWEVDFGDGTSRTGEGENGSVTYQWEASGQYTVQVTALSGGTSVGSTTRRVTVQSPLQLSVSNIRPNPSNLDIGQEFQVVFDIQNASATPVDTSFDVSIYLTQDSSVSRDQIGDLTEVASGPVQGASDSPVIPASSTRTVDLQATIPEGTEAGEYNLVASIPPDQLATENPEDSFGVSTRIIQVADSIRPDVAVEEVYTLSDRAYPALSGVNRGFTLANNGGGEAFEFKTMTYLSVGDAELDTSEDTKIHESESTYDIPAQGSTEVGPDRITLEEDITAPNEDKEVYVIVKAEPTGETGETNTDNNTGASPAITVSNELADGPDIVVDSFSVAPETTYLDGPLQVDMTVKNEGTADYGSFPCRLYLSEEPRIDTASDTRFSSISIPGLESGATEEIDQPITVPALFDSGEYYVYTYCNPDGLDDETFGDNNRKLHPDPIEITDQADVDLFVEQLEVPSEVQEGDEIELTAQACVDGQNASGETQGELYMSTGNQVSFEQDPFKTFTIPNVTPGTCEEISLTFTADCEDFEQQYAFGIKADTNDDLPENDESNNRVRGSNPLTINGEYCQCTYDAYEPDPQNQPENYTDAATFTSGSYSASICRPGSCDYFSAVLDNNQSLMVETTFPADKGALETALYHSDGVTTIDSDDTPGRQRVATFNVGTNDQTYYYWSVCGDTSSARNLYDMNVEILSPKSGVDLIPRRPKLPSQDTFSIGEEIPVDVRIHNIGDTATSENFDLGLAISPDRTAGNGNDIPLDPPSVPASAVTAGGSIDVETEAEIPTSLNAGEYYIVATVDPTDSQSETTTSNNTAISRQIEVEAECYDPLEPNDSLSSPRTISERSYSNLNACAQSDDYYKLCVNDDEKFTITTNFNNEQGDIDLELFDQNFNIVDSSAQVGVDQEEVSVDYVNGDQCYYLHTFLRTNQTDLETTYSMNVDVQNVAPHLQCASHFEPNNAPDSAASYISGINQTAKLDRCPASDTDFYRLELERAQQITLRGNLEPDTQSGTLTLALLRQTSQGLTPVRSQSTAPGIPTAEIADYIVPAAGTYYARVTISGSQRNVTYTLGAEGLGGIDLKASNLSIWGSSSLQPGGDLLYEFDLTNGRTDTAVSPSHTVYLSSSSTLNTSQATKLTSATHADVQGNSTTHIGSQQTQLPSSVPSGATRYVHIKVEADSSQTDQIPGNNVVTRQVQFQ